MIVLDASFLVAWHNTRDVHHPRARRVMERLVAGELGIALLPEYVFLEVVTVLALRREHRVALEAADHLRNAREVLFVPCSPYFEQTLAVFREHAAKGLSFADAAIVAISEARGADAVATFDKGFRRIAGIRVVPKPG